MSKKRILVCDPVHESGLNMLRDAGLDVQHVHGSDDPSLKEELPEANGLIVRSGTTVDTDLLSAAPDLEVIGRAGIGVDNIDLDAASRHGIVVMNTPMGNIRSAAEHAIGLMFAVSRNIPDGDRAVKENRWPRKELTGVQLRGKTLALIGLGKVGTEVAEMAQGLGMDVIAVDPYLSEERANELSINLVSLDDALRNCDILSIHTPLNENTRNMIGADELEKMNPDAILINCARGGIVNEDDLVRALKSNQIKAAGIDTFEEEPPEDSPLIKLDNVVLTPHLGASTEEAQKKVSTDIADQLIDFFEKDVIRNAVNAVSVGDPEMHPVMELSRVLGSIGSQLIDGSITEVDLKRSGELADRDPEPISLSTLQGLLEPFSDHVNLVNAKIVARDRGIDLTESRSEEAEDFESTVAVSLRTPDEELSLTGTILEDGDPRLITFDGLKVDVKPTSRMLFMWYPDVPGQVGKFGSILGEHDINIASMEVGRKARGEEAIVILTLDDTVPEVVQKKLREEAGVRELGYLEL